LLGEELTHEILSDWRKAPINEKLRTALGFVVKLTKTPEHIGPRDVASLQEQGITERAIIDAAYICMGFNVINRIADAMNFNLPPAGVFDRGAWFMRRFGYRLMSGSWTSNNRGRVPSNEIDPYDAMMRRLQDAVFSGPGTLDATVRQAIGAGTQVSGVLGQYVSKVAQRDYRGIGNCIADLRLEGYSDDQIFEATVSAALGAGVKRLQLVLQALRGSVSSQAA
jgi:alkylhydroperoxidase family enzyme